MPQRKSDQPNPPSHDQWLVDTHAHLDMYKPQDLPAVVHRADAAGVHIIVTVGTDLDSCRKTLAIIDTYENTYAIVGIHPHHAAEVSDDDLEQIRKMTRHPKVKGWGEIGLDFYRNYSPHDLQRERFRQQIRIAKELSLPLIIHSRNATTDTLNILREEKADDTGGIVHCFSGNPTDASRFLDINFYISIPGVVTYPGAVELRNAVRTVPHDRLLLETDAPFLTPVPHRGRRNEPAYVYYTARTVAELRGESIDILAARTTDNAQRVLRLSC